MVQLIKDNAELKNCLPTDKTRSLKNPYFVAQSTKLNSRKTKQMLIRSKGQAVVVSHE